MKNINDLDVVEPIILNTENSEEKDLIMSYPNMILNKNQDQAITKKNIVSELKQHFPNVKFSVKKEYFDCYGVSWFEAVTIEEVDKVISKFIDHVTDVTGDFRDPNPTTFNNLFGGFKYISTYRNFGESKKILLEQLSILMNDDDKLYPNNVSDTLYRVLRKNSFSVGAVIKKIIINENFTAGLFEDKFIIVSES